MIEAYEGENGYDFFFKFGYNGCDILVNKGKLLVDCGVIVYIIIEKFYFVEFYDNFDFKKYVIEFVDGS